MLDFRQNSLGGCGHGLVTSRFLLTRPASAQFCCRRQGNKPKVNNQKKIMEKVTKQNRKPVGTLLWQMLTEHSRTQLVEVCSCSWSKEKLKRLLLGHVAGEQASLMKGSSFTIEQESSERTTHRITLKVDSPTGWPEIWIEHKKKMTRCVSILFLLVFM